MKQTLRLLVVSAIALMISIPAAFAQSPEASTLPVTEPLLVGNTTLQPGTYVIKLIRSPYDRNKVQITSVNGDTVFATLLTVPHQLEPGEEVPNTKFVFYPAESGLPRALRTWFAPNPSASQGGHDIVYEETRAQQLAKLSNSRVVSYHDATTVADMDTTELHVVTPEATVETYTYTPPPAPVAVATPAPVVAEAETSAPMMSSETETTVQTASAETPEMPQTASKLPLLALLGFVSLAGALAVRMARG
jgi:hypothetical protein